MQTLAAHEAEAAVLELEQKVQFTDKPAKKSKVNMQDQG